MTTQSIPLASQDRIDKTAQAVHICFLMALLILFNVYSDEVGIYRTLLEPSSFTPLLGTGFEAALPWLNAYWLAALALASVLLFFEQWTEELRLAGLSLAIFGVVVAWRLLSGASLVVGLGWSGPLVGDRFPFSTWPLWGLNAAVQLALSIWLVTQVVDALRHLARLLPHWVPSLGRVTRS